MRYALLIVLGLVIGIIGATTVINSRNEGLHPAQSLMRMMGYYSKTLHKSQEQNRCGVSDSLPHLQALRALSNDIEPTFGSIGSDVENARFGQRASNLRSSIDALLANPPATCAALGAALNNVDHACSSCHKEFRD